MPSANVIRLTQDGEVVAEGPINADGPEVAGAAHLLDDLLPGFDAPPEFRAPGGLRLAIARALGTLDAPSFSSLEEFCAAIDRFAATDVRSVARELFESWSSSSDAVPEAVHAVQPAAVESRAALGLTISDVRRARRATGLSLAEVSLRSRIPASLLRELEWGYLRNWPAGLYGRSQLVRYARAAGLDERLVVDVATPLIQEAVQARQNDTVEIVPAEQPIEALVPLGPATIEVFAPPPDDALTLPVKEAEVVVPVRSRHGSRRAWRTAMAIAALVLLSLAPLAWQHLNRSGAPADEILTSLTAPSRAAAPPEQRAPASETPKAPTPAIPRTRVTVPDGALPAVSKAEPLSGLTTQPAAYSPTFSNTGTAMFFHESEPAGSALMRADTDSQGTVLKITRIVDDNARNFHARPSPDGSQIAFDSDRDGVRAVYVADADGQHVRRVSGDGFAAVPSWSPDGRQLAFVKAEADKPRVWNLWTVDLDSGELRRLTSYLYGQPWGGSWFPDGYRIAYSHEEQLVVLDLRNAARKVFNTPRAGHLVRTPAVSPDGRRIVFQVYRDGTWLLDLRNASMRRVLDDPSAEEFAWSPDGKRVAFHSERAGGWGVWVMGSSN